jgi:hypothetical protein
MDTTAMEEIKQTCGNCEYHHQGICNAGRNPTPKDEPNSCSDFEQLDVFRSAKAHQETQAKVTNTPDNKPIRSFMSVLNQQFHFIYNLYGIRPREFLVHPETLWQEIRQQRIAETFISRTVGTIPPVFIPISEIQQSMIEVAGMRPILSTDVMPNTLRVLVPIEVLYGRDFGVIAPFNPLRNL